MRTESGHSLAHLLSGLESGVFIGRLSMADILVGVNCVFLVVAGGCIAKCDAKLTAGDISMNDLVGGAHWTVVMQFL